MQPTFFEYVFAMSLLAFKAHQVDLAIVEAGIGGLLDTTNVLDRTLVSVITSIGMDHQDLLGDNLEAIARQKAGIIKPGGQVVYANEKPEVEAVIEEVVRKKEAKSLRLYPILEKVIKRQGETIDFSANTLYYRYKGLKLKTYADYQVDNALLALLVIHSIKTSFPVNQPAIYQGLLSFHHPGRFEQIHPRIMIDGAHNRPAFNQFLETVDQHFADQPKSLLLAIKEGKDLQAILACLKEKPLFDPVYISSISSVASVGLGDLAKALQDYPGQIKPVNDLNQWVKQYINEQNQKKELLFCAGSLYLVSDVRTAVKEEDDT
jgi:dihydrofolate synthase/folylpolyglutamate synthase